MIPSWRCSSRRLASFACMVGVVACAPPNEMASVNRANARTSDRGEPRGAARVSAAAEPDIQRGRELVLDHACSACHSGVLDPAGAGFLAGITQPQFEFTVEGFKTRPRNLTPDNETGLGRFSERQIFNALRFGLRPGETLDV